MNYRVFIIEDDFHVAEINKEFINKINGFSVCGIAHTAKETMTFLENSEQLPDLILLDVYIPDVEGLKLMWKIRNDFQVIDIIMVTAANEGAIIEEALRGGVFDYLIKPIDFKRLKQALITFQEKKTLFQNKSEMNQEEIDKLQGFSKTSGATEKTQGLPKGIDRLTLNKVTMVLEKIGHKGVTAVEISKEIGTSRSTARRYLEYLVQINQAHAELKYGDVGRPERRYVYICTM